MATIGLSKPFYAKYAVNNGTVSYSAGAALAKAVEINVEINTSNSTDFYADNGIAETAGAIFTSGTLTLDIDELAIADAAAIFGGTVETVSTPSGSALPFGANTVPPYLGFGVIVKRIKGGTVKWRALLLHKIQFAMPQTQATTQGETIEFAAPQLTATILRDDSTDALWQTWAEFDTEANAETWIKGKLSIT